MHARAEYFHRSAALGGYTEPFNDNGSVQNVAASLVKRQLAVLIKRFKFEELEDAVMPLFPEITWSRVRSKLIKNHKNFTVANVVRVIEEVLDVRIALRTISPSYGELTLYHNAVLTSRLFAEHRFKRERPA